MGHKEDLLEGAKRCLYEKGYARTTARDLVAASGTNLGSIGYHYGSKEALLDAALIEALGEMNEALGRLTSVEHAEGDLAAAWQRIVEEFDTHRPLLVAQVEAWAQIERSPELRERFVTFYEQEKAGGVEYMLATRPEIDEHTARAVVAVTSALADGLILQWLIDPELAPSGRDMAIGLRALADVMDGQQEP